MVIGGIGDENFARAIRSAQHTEVNAQYAIMMTLGGTPEKSRDVRHVKTIDHTLSTDRMETTKKNSNRRIVLLQL